MTTFEAWQSPDETEISLSTPENHTAMAAGGFGPDSDWTLLHRIEAPNFESALKEHHRLMGYEPYKPLAV